MSKLNIQTVGDLLEAHRRRAAGMQELRRHLAQRGPREADGAGPEAQERLTRRHRRPAPAGTGPDRGSSVPDRLRPVADMPRLESTQRRLRCTCTPVGSDPASIRLGARSGLLETPHGSVETPAFMPVGTQATVKGLTPDQIRATGTRMVLANTYHLALRPGEDVVAALGGLHRSWAGTGRS